MSRIVDKINEMSTAGTEMDREFLVWAPIWNAMIRDWKHIDRTLEEAAVWEPLERAIRRLLDVRREYEKARGKE